MVARNEKKMGRQWKHHATSYRTYPNTFLVNNISIRSMPIFKAFNLLTFDLKFLKALHALDGGESFTIFFFRLFPPSNLYCNFFFFFMRKNGATWPHAETLWKMFKMKICVLDLKISQTDIQTNFPLNPYSILWFRRFAMTDCTAVVTIRH